MGDPPVLDANLPSELRDVTIFDERQKGYYRHKLKVQRRREKERRELSVLWQEGQAENSITL